MKIVILTLTILFSVMTMAEEWKQRGETQCHKLGYNELAIAESLGSIRYEEEHGDFVNDPILREENQEIKSLHRELIDLASSHMRSQPYDGSDCQTNPELIIQAIDKFTEYGIRTENPLVKDYQ